MLGGLEKMVIRGRFLPPLLSPPDRVLPYEGGTKPDHKPACHHEQLLLISDAHDEVIRPGFSLLFLVVSGTPVA